MVPKLWPNSTVVCIGGGPSLTAADVDLCRGQRAIAINDAYKLAPWADCLYAADAEWWKWHDGVPSFEGQKYAIERQPGAGRERFDAWPDIRVLRNTGDEGLELDPTGLRTGRNSGYQAINLAVHLGATRVLLLGYDMQNAENGKTHWFGDHPHRRSSPYGAFLYHFTTLITPLGAAGVEVINCTRRSALECFFCADLESALAREAEA